MGEPTKSGFLGAFGTVVVLTIAISMCVAKSEESQNSGGAKQSSGQKGPRKARKERVDTGVIDAGPSDGMTEAELDRRVAEAMRTPDARRYFAIEMESRVGVTIRAQGPRNRTLMIMLGPCSKAALLEEFGRRGDPRSEPFRNVGFRRVACDDGINRASIKL